MAKIDLHAEVLKLTGRILKGRTDLEKFKVRLDELEVQVALSRKAVEFAKKVRKHQK